MMICPKCSKNILDESAFCNFCGSKISTIENKKYDILKNNSKMIDKRKNLKEGYKKTKIKKDEKTKIPQKRSRIIAVMCITIGIAILISYIFLYSPLALKRYNTKDTIGNTYLMNYIAKNNTAKAKELIKLGVDIDIQNNNGDNALILAAEKKNREIVDLLLSKKDSQDKEKYVDVRDKVLNTALLIAVKNDDVSICKELLDAGAFTRISNKYGETPLNLCVKNDNMKSLQFLIDNKLDINFPNQDGDTPLLLAVKLQKKSIVQFLINKGANINVRDKNENNVYNICAQRKDGEILKSLLSNNKDEVVEINIQNFEFSKSREITPSYNYQKVLLKNNDLYNFFMSDGVKILNDPKGSKIYEGNITNGKINGYGVAYFSHDGMNENTSMHKGNWKDGFWDEKGVYENGYKVDSVQINSSDSQGQINEDKKSDPFIGMTDEQVRNSTWGSPENVNKTTTAYGTSEQWVYSGYKYIYLYNGIVTAIQEH